MLSQSIKNIKIKYFLNPKVLSVFVFECAEWFYLLFFFLTMVQSGIQCNRITTVHIFKMLYFYFVLVVAKKWINQKPVVPIVVYLKTE